MTNMINGYILYRLMVDRNNKSTRPRRHSLMPLSEGQKTYVSQLQRKSLIEPFCLPVIQHVPIRQRLSSVGHDISSADICSDLDPAVVVSSNPYLYRRRRMSLLQTLRYQNRLLADSGVECRSQQSDRGSETARGHLSSYSSPFSSSEPKDSRRSSSIIKLKNKYEFGSKYYSKFSYTRTFAFFGKRSSKRSQTCDEQISSNGCTKYCQNDQPIYSSIDLSAKEARQGKSPSMNDSGHESQGRIVTDEEYQDDKNGDRYSKQQETVAVIEQSSEMHSGTRIRVAGQHKYSNLIRSFSCPQLGLNLLICHENFRRATSHRQEFLLVDDTDSEEDIEDNEAFIEKPFIADENQFKANTSGSTPTKSVQSSSYETTECVVERDEFRYAAKLHRDCSLLESQENSTSEELSFPQQQQQQEVLQKTKKLEHLRLCNGYVTGQFAYVLPRPGRNSLASHVSTEIKKNEVGEEDERSLSTETFWQSEMGKEILDCYPELDSLPSFYSGDEDDDDNLSSLMLDHYLPPKYSKLMSNLLLAC
uniref:PEHE domain-containing protein n=1 Tax=Elaeophora elaphi TaxID=1147741 RepID=A0A0R3RKR0_9BILA